VVEAAVAAAAVEWVPVEVETSPVIVVEEAEPRNDARRHGAEEAHSLQAPLVEPEKVVAVEASDDAVPLARARCGVQVVAGPHVARVEMPELRVAHV
jgi:hypothetical protein